MKTTENTVGMKRLTALDEYINRVYVLVLLMIPGAATCAGLLYTLERFIGFLPDVSWSQLIVFDITCVIYLGIGIFLVRTGFENGIVAAAKLKAGKIFLVAVCIIQFNFILYMIPATDFWGFAFYFIVLMAFFLDYKMVAIASAGIAASLVVAGVLKGEVHLPAHDTYFMANLLDRIVCVVLSLPTTVLLIYLISHFLVSAKKDEMEKNNERVQNVLAAVSDLSDKLLEAGSALSQISVNESASAEELAATSESLLINSNALGEKADRNMDQLNELGKWADMVNANVEKVENTSRNLLSQSENSEKLLQSLQGINSEVAKSMNDTNAVAEKLSEAVKEIDVTLNLINDISSSTNLLALNASIEAARAGEAGKGFAVVASEVGNLANSTQQSLDEVKGVIDRVQDNVGEMIRYVDENAQKLARQNEVFEQVFRALQEMMQMLHHSMEDINTMSEVHDKQTEVIMGTLTISKDIVEDIRKENQEFSNINTMVDNNAADMTDMAKQVTAINTMADEINELLNQ